MTIFFGIHDVSNIKRLKNKHRKMDRYTPQENVKYVKKKTNKIECEKNGVETRITKSTRATTSSCCYGN